MFFNYIERKIMAFKKQYLKSKPVCKVTFKLTKEEAKAADSVSIVGDFNNWDKSSTVMAKYTKMIGRPTLTRRLQCQLKKIQLLNFDTWLPVPVSILILVQGPCVISST